jgi:hypothetical protein
VAFLSCGSALQPILPKSQCWGIDEGSSKFILQIRRPQFWRIEIPASETESDRRAVILRDVFDKILQFEKTPCPFQRTFTVELPERPQTPVKKRPWTPVRRPTLSMQLPPTPVTPVNNTSRLRLAGEEPTETPTNESFDEPTCSGEASLVEGELSTVVKATSNNNKAEQDVKSEELDKSQSSIAAPLLLQGKLAGFQTSRVVTAPPELSLQMSPPSKGTSQSETSIDDDPTAPESPTESLASFHSIQAWHSPITPLPPSPPVSNPSSPTTFPYPHDNIALPKPQFTHQREFSDATVTPDMDKTWLLSPTGADIISLESSSDTSSVYEDVMKPESADEGSDSRATSGVSTETPQPRIRHRSTTSNMSISTNRPLPPAANLFTPYRQFPRYNSHNRAQTRLEAVQRLPGAIIHRTCEILLAPPAQLLTLMLRVAARIAAGEWRGMVFGTGEEGESIPVQWDYSDDDPNGWCVDAGTRRASAVTIPEEVAHVPAQEEDEADSPSVGSWGVD